MELDLQSHIHSLKHLTDWAVREGCDFSDTVLRNN